MTLATTLSQFAYFLKNGGSIDSAIYANAQAFTLGDDSLLINGRMEFSQDLGGVLTTLASGTPKYVADQWVCLYVHAANTAVIKSQQVSALGSAIIGNAFPNCLTVTATTALVSPAANDCVQVYQPIEASRFAKLGNGITAASSASTYTFWVYATVSGTATFQYKNAVPNRTFLYNFAVTGGTWNFITIPVPPDISGTWATAIGSLGAYIGLCFVGGTSTQGTNNVWQAGNLASTSATTNFFATANNQVSVTGFNWHPGNTGPSAARSMLVMRPPEDELRYCQRFYQKIGGTYASILLESVASASGNYCTAVVPYYTQMRYVPQVSQVGTWTTTNLSTSARYYPADNLVGIEIVSATSGMYSYYPANSTGFLALTSRF